MLQLLLRRRFLTVEPVLVIGRLWTFPARCVDVGYAFIYGPGLPAAVVTFLWIAAFADGLIPRYTGRRRLLRLRCYVAFVFAFRTFYTHTPPPLPVVLLLPYHIARLVTHYVRSAIRHLPYVALRSPHSSGVTLVVVLRLIYSRTF